MKCYHFCTKEFFNKLSGDQLINNQSIIADNRQTRNTNQYAYDYIFKYKNLNNGNGMFFAWQDPTYKGYEIEYCDEQDANYVLLELDVPEDLQIKTNYENWCSFICDLDEVDGDLDLADQICRDEYGIEDGLDGSFNSIFDIGPDDQIQFLLPEINFNWIKSHKFTKNIII